MRSFWIAAGLYLIALLWLDLGFIPYPADNDLQFIGWMAEHLRLSRPESLLGKNYPFPMGFPLLMRGLTPLFGSIVRAALFCQAVASTLGLLLVFAITRKLFASERAAGAAAFAAAAVNFPVAISEFADSLAALAVLFGLWVLLEDLRSPRRQFIAGLTIGAAYLIRFHYLTFLIIFPAALLVLRSGLKAFLSCTAALLAGFAVAVSPLIAGNLIVYRVPLHTGLSSYILGYNAVEAVDWNDFPATYALWPVSRVLAERPGAFLWTMVKNLGSFLHPFALFTLAAAVAGLIRSRQRIAGYLLALAGGYVVLDILISRYTNRAAVPAFLLLSIVSMGLVVPLQWPRFVKGVALAGIAAGLAVHGYKQVLLVKARRADLQENQAVVRVLKENGFRESGEVFCNDWNIYNLDHPFLEPFYDYGGYMLLDSEYAAQRPLPRGDFDAFARRQGIRFAILVRGLPGPEVTWRRIFSDARLDVYRRDS